MFGLENFGLWGLFLGTFLAATIFPFNSDALYFIVLMATKDPLRCFLYGTVGNWLGGITTYWIGRIGRWEWIEKHFKVQHATLEHQQHYVNRFGVWLALLSCIPIIGDVIVLALGFYKARPLWTMLLLLIGKAARFLIWNIVYGIMPI